MVNKMRELFSFTKNRRGGYALLTSILLLGLICLAVVWQYRYYTAQWQLEDQLAREFLRAAGHNLTIKK